MNPKPNKRYFSNLNSRAVIIVLLAAFVLTAGCSALGNPVFRNQLGDGLSRAFPAQPELLVPQIIATYPHDTDSYTQGLLWSEGVLYESDGGNSTYGGESSLRKTTIETGEILQVQPVADPIFAEGLALVDDKLIQLTWKDGVAYVYDSTTFRLLGAFEYEGDGWGLCYDGRYLYMTDGSHILYVREPDTFEIVKQIPVMFQGQPMSRLNELECVGDEIYANVYFQNYILRINKHSGWITAAIDASFLLSQDEYNALAGEEVLNGIAYNPEDDVFYLTGKNWPKLFEVRFVPLEEVTGK